MYVLSFLPQLNPHSLSSIPAVANASFTPSTKPPLWGMYCPSSQQTRGPGPYPSPQYTYVCTYASTTSTGKNLSSHGSRTYLPGGRGMFSMPSSQPVWLIRWGWEATIIDGRLDRTALLCFSWLREAVKQGQGVALSILASCFLELLSKLCSIHKSLAPLSSSHVSSSILLLAPLAFPSWCTVVFTDLYHTPLDSLLYIKYLKATSIVSTCFLVQFLD